MTPPTFTADHVRIQQLERELYALRYAFITMLAWIAQSAASPLSVKEAQELMRLSEPQEP